MKGNINNYDELKNTVNYIYENKIDYTRDSRQVRMAEDDILLFQGTNADIEKYKINETAHQQLSSKLNIPKKYYDAMLSIPGLRSQNVNSWLTNQDNKKYFIRTFNGQTRAFLSDKYRPIDHYFLLDAFMPVIEKHNDFEIVSSSLTEKRMYLQIVFPSIQAEVEVGDIVQTGITLSNSEVGCGAVNICEMIYRLSCKNGMIGKSVLNKYHVGSRINHDIDNYNFFRQDTIEAELISFQKRLRDILSHTISQAFLIAKVEKMKKAIQDKINNTQKTVENVSTKYSLTETETDMVINNLINEGQSNRWTLANSITALCHDLQSRDRQYDIERIGNDIIELPSSQWEVLSA